MPLLALLGAAFFLFSRTGEALGAHACLHHELPGAASATEHGSRVADHGHPALAERAAEPTDPTEHAGPCTCAGPCYARGSCLATDVALRRALNLFWVRWDVGCLASGHPRQILLPFFHPYATAPPPSA